MKKAVFILSFLSVFSYLTAAENTKSDPGQLKLSNVMEDFLDKQDLTLKERTIARILFSQIEKMDPSARQELLDKLFVKTQSDQERVKMLEGIIGKDLINDLSLNDALKMLTILSVPYGAYIVVSAERIGSNMQPVLNFLNKQRKCLEGVTCSGRKVLLMNYLFGIATHEIAARGKNLRRLGMLNNLRKIYIAAFPDMPIPDMPSGELKNISDILNRIWLYLKSSSKCLVTGSGCTVQRRAAMYYMLGFYSAKTMHTINWDKWINRLTGKLEILYLHSLKSNPEKIESLRFE